MYVIQYRSQMDANQSQPTSPSSQIPAQPKSTSSSYLGTVSLVTGILALLTGLLLVGGLFGVVAVVTGIIAFKKNVQKRMALTGVILGGLGILIAAYMTATTGYLYFDAKRANTNVDYSSQPLKTYKTGAIELSYPESWEEKSKEGTIEYWTDGTYLSREDEDYSAVSSRLIYEFDISQVARHALTLEESRKLAGQATKDDDSIALPLSQYADCYSVKIERKSDFNQGGLVGKRMDFTCRLNSDKSHVKGVGIVAADSSGILHSYTLFTTSDTIWKNNQPVFEKMIASFKAVDRSTLKPEPCAGKQVGNMCVTGGGH